MSGSAAQLWLFPVKSMGGTRVDQLRIDRRGVHADRLWAVRDLAHNITASARRAPALLGCSARYAIDPGPDAGPGCAPEVIVTMPYGKELSSCRRRTRLRLVGVASSRCEVDRTAAARRHKPAPFVSPTDPRQLFGKRSAP